VCSSDLWREKTGAWASFFTSMLLCLTVYLVFSTTVHPWYVAPLVAFSVLAPWTYSLVWSMAAVLSYSAYQARPYTENLWLVAIEYVSVGGAVIYDTAFHKVDKMG
jgi:hypothetical protein